MKASKATKQAPKIRVIRGNAPEINPRVFEEGVDSPIRSSVDSWLSSVPSLKPSKPKPKKIPMTKPNPIIEDNEEDNYDPHRKWVLLAIVIFSILIVCSIVGIILAVIFRQ